MFKRRLLALAASLAIGFPTTSVAMVLPDNSEDLPSSFAANVTRSNSEIDRPVNTATIELTDKVDIFSRYKFPGVSFENAASVGLSAARPEPRTRSIEQMIATARERESVVQSPDETSGLRTDIKLAGPPKEPETGNTLRDAAEALVNRPKTNGKRRAHDKEPYSFGSGLGYTLIDSVLQSQMDGAFISAATDIINPTIDPDGLVSLNLMGLRDFAFIISPVTNNIQVLDFKTGTTLTVSHSAYIDAPVQRKKATRQKGPPSATERNIAKFIQNIKYFSEHFLLQPLTLGALLLLAACAGVMGIGRKTA